MKNYNPGYEPQMLGKVLVVFQNHKNASDALKPFSAAAGSDVFCQCFHTGIDWEFMAGVPFLRVLVWAARQLREQEDAVASLKCSTFPNIFVSGNRYKSKSSQFMVGKKGKTLENDEQGYECAKKQLNGMLKFLLQFLSFARGIKIMCNHVCRLHLKWGREHNKTFC